MTATPEQIQAINARIAEWCGVASKTVNQTRTCPYCDNEIFLIENEIPNYFGSLDACAEFEARLTEEEYSRYAWALLGSGDIECRAFLSATAPQRCEALFRTMGWEWPLDAKAERP